MVEALETIPFDIVLIGAGPANLAAALHLQHLIGRHNQTASEPVEASLALIEKGRHAGAHLLSGAILDTRALEELMPDYHERGCPLEAEVTQEHLAFLTKNRKLPIPFIPEAFRNRGLRTCSLSRLGSWLMKEAETAGVACFESTAALKPLYREGRLSGIVTDHKGLDRNGQPKQGHEPGIILEARAFLVGEGAGGSITRELERHFRLCEGKEPQRYETGVKETWRIPPGRIQAGTTHHTFGHPLPADRYGGGWVYAFSETELSVGFVTTIEPSAPVADPQLNLQRFKTHPFVASLLEGGSMLESGARTISSGGYHAMPRPWGPGFLLTGESAGMLDMQRLKGIHLAMKSGILAAETIFEGLRNDDFSEKRLASYQERITRSWVHDELHRARNYRKAFDGGLYHGLMQAGVQLQFPGLPFADAKRRKSPEAAALDDEKELAAFSSTWKPDGVLTFSKADALFSSATAHEEDQPCHLKISDESIATICLTLCRERYANPCRHFCPAGVYEFIGGEDSPSLRINASNCLHCKTCESADPFGVITWTPPEGGGGPGYNRS